MVVQDNHHQDNHLIISPHPSRRVFQGIEDYTSTPSTSIDIDDVHSRALPVTVPYARFGTRIFEQQRTRAGETPHLEKHAERFDHAQVSTTSDTKSPDLLERVPPDFGHETSWTIRRPLGFPTRDPSRLRCPHPEYSAFSVLGPGRV
jgi:hypothetical protein